MPVYEFRCENKSCDGGSFDVFQAVHQDHRALCPICGKRARRIYTPAAFSIDFREGYDPGLGRYVTSQKHREEVMREVGARRIKD